MDCSKTEFFLDLPLISAYGDQLCQILAALTRQLQPHKLDLIWKTRRHE